jgi:hypothetical protein
MTRHIGAKRAGVIALTSLAWLFFLGSADAQDCYHCQRTHCPPAWRHCMEGPPRIRWQCGCPLPICNPCYAPNWGYFQTCWTPWPWPQDWSHCPVTPPAAYVNLAPVGATPAPRTPRLGVGEEMLPPPQLQYRSGPP